MIIGTFNVENLFERPRAMNLPNWREGQPAIDAAAELNALFNKRVYREQDKRRMLHLLKKHELLGARPNNQFLELRKIRGALLEQPTGKPARIVATGRASWVGWVDLKKEPLADDAIVNTARVIAAVQPDILVLVEVESRPVLQHFHDKVLMPLIGREYRYNMVIDGNDQRGIDVGILSPFPIAAMRSHIDDRSGDVPTFSRDCPEYFVELPSGRELVILPNHFASKGSDVTGRRRKVQATAASQIYKSVRKRRAHVIVAGDLNDHPKGGSLSPLLGETDLVDAMALKQYGGAFPGTYGHATAQQKIDYLLLSPGLRSMVRHVDVFRKGFYAPRKWESFENITKENKDRYQASDHHCLRAEVDI